MSDFAAAVRHDRLCLTSSRRTWTVEITVFPLLRQSYLWRRLKQLQEGNLQRWHRCASTPSLHLFCLLYCCTLFFFYCIVLLGRHIDPHIKSFYLLPLVTDGSFWFFKKRKSRPELSEAWPDNCQVTGINQKPIKSFPDIWSFCVVRAVKLILTAHFNNKNKSQTDQKANNQ